MNANFRRQFQRVAQRIDQHIGRAERSKVLNEEQEDLEKRVELLRQVCQNVTKKVQGCLSSQGQPLDAEKRMKKLPKSAFSSVLIESSVQLGQQSHSGQVFRLCGDAEGKAAVGNLELEVNVEENVLKPLTELLEVDIPSIQKLKKQLNTRTLDMDAAKTRYQAAVKQSQQAGGLQSKVDAAREEVEDSMTKMEQTRDQLATDMYTFVAKESELSRCMLELVRAEVLYHRQTLQVFEALIPQLEESIEFSIPKPLFGLALESHLERSGREVASVLEDCISALMDYGLDEEGLFRIAGAASKVKKLKAALNTDNTTITLCPEEYDAHVVSTVLKQYLRELPQPLMTFELYNDWLQALHAPADQRLPILQATLNKMPKPYKQNLRFLIKFLAKLSEYSEVNKMSPSNIALVIGPNLMWPSGDTAPNMLTSGLQSATSIVELLIINVDYFFPGVDDVDSRPVNPSLTAPSAPPAVTAGHRHSITLTDSTGITSPVFSNDVGPASAPVLTPAYQPIPSPGYHPSQPAPAYHPPVYQPPASQPVQPTAFNDHDHQASVQPISVQTADSMPDKDKLTRSASNSPSIAKRYSKKAPAPRPPVEATPAPATLPAIDTTVTTTISTTDPLPSPSSHNPLSPRFSRPREPPPERPQAPSEKPPLPPASEKSGAVRPESTISDLMTRMGPSVFSGGNTEPGTQPQQQRLYPVLPDVVGHLSSTPGAPEKTAEKQHRRQLSDTGPLGSRPPRPTPPPPPAKH